MGGGGLGIGLLWAEDVCAGREGGGGLCQPGKVKSSQDIPDVVSGQEVPDWGRIYPRQLDTRSRWERGEWMNGSSRR